MKRPQNIDDLIRQGLLDPASPVSDWDSPSDGIWDEIERRIRPSRRRRGMFWWFLGGLLIAILGLSVLLFQTNISAPPGHAVSSDDDEMASFAPRKSIDSPNSASIDQPTQIDQPADIRHMSPEKHSALNRSSRTEPDATQSHEQPVNTPHEQQVDGFLSAGSGQKRAVSQVPDETDIAKAPNPEIRHVIGIPEPLIAGPYLLKMASLAPMSPQATSITPLQKESMWSLALSMGPSFGSRNIHVPASHPRVLRNLLLHNEDPVVQLGFRLSISRDFNARWSLGTGIDYNRYVLKGTSQRQLRYTSAGEVRNGRGNFENTFNLNLNTSFGEVKTDIIVERSSDATINENQFISLDLHTHQSMQVLQIPLVLKYRLPIGRMAMSLRGGPAVNILLENSMDFTAVRSLSSGIVQTRAQRSVKLSGSRDFALGYQLGADLEIPVDRQCSVVIAPDFSGYVQPLYRDRHVIIYPHVFSVNAGVKYTFR